MAHNRRAPAGAAHCKDEEAIMAGDDRADDSGVRAERLTRELEEAELFAQRLRAYIAAIREEVAAGRTGRALSMCNQALTEIDSATDVVSPSPHLKEQAGLEADYPPRSGKHD
jgi:hypothetical protein